MATTDVSDVSRFEEQIFSQSYTAPTDDFVTETSSSDFDITAFIDADAPTENLAAADFVFDDWLSESGNQVSFGYSDLHPQTGASSSGCDAGESAVGCF
jgi:hypothetical protein